MNTLYTKLSLALALLLIAVGIVYGVISLSATQRHLEAVSQTLNRKLARTLVADRNLVREGRIDEEAIKKLFHEYMQINPGIEIYLLGTEGEIMSFSADPKKVVRDRVSLAPIERFLTTDAIPVLGDDPRNRDLQKAFSVTPIPSSQNVEGYLYVVLRGEAFDVATQAFRESYFVRLSLYAIGISLFVALLAGLLVFWRMTRRVRRLSSSMGRFLVQEAGSANSTALFTDDATGDEIDLLERAFELMSARIKEQIQLLKSQDTQRREMVANVSHDLRTPLASMNGYLETLKLKQRDLSDATKQEYLEVALRYGRQLAKLVEDLFELAKLEAMDQQPDLEPCSIPDLIQDVVQKLGLKANARGVTIKADAPKDLPLACVDIRLIERLLENIIVNAVDHNPRGTQISVSAQGGNGGVDVVVRDNGKGIREGDMPHLFERFYRGKEPDAYGQEGHAGLGLAIAKQILALHAQTLSVESRPGRGTAIAFTLPGVQSK